MRSTRSILFAILTLSACGDGPTEPNDTTNPVVQVSSGTENIITNQTPFRLTGSAIDDGAIGQVTWTVGDASGMATGSTNWSADIPLQPGTNTVEIRAVDAAGNTGSATVTIVLDALAPDLLINTPNNEFSVTTNAATYTLTGVASDNVGLDRIEWQNDRGPAGTASGTTAWETAVELADGDNRITIRAVDRAGNTTTRDFLITKNAAVVFLSEPSMLPASVRTNTPTPVRVRVKVSLSAGVLPSSVRVVKADAAGAVVADVGTLYDDGRLSVGDDIAGDGVFSGILTLTESAPGTARYRVRATVGTGGATHDELSAFVALTVVQPLTSAQYRQIIAAQDSAAARLDRWYDGNNMAAALDSTVVWLLTQPGVANATRVDETAIDVGYASGVRGGLLVADAGTRGGGGFAPAPTTRTTLDGGRWTSAQDTTRRRANRIPLAQQTRGTRPSSLMLNTVSPSPMFATASAVSQDQILNRRVLIFAPFEDEFAPHNEGDAIVGALTASPLDFTVDHFRNAGAGVAQIAAMSRYGTVIIASHGAVLPSVGTVFMTGEVATETKTNQTYAGYMQDQQLIVLQHAVRVGGEIERQGNFYTVTSRFVRALPDAFPNSVVFNNSCQGAKTPDMTLAFSGKGARTYLGWTRNVSTSGAAAAAVEFTRTLAVDLKTTGEAFTPRTDSSEGAVFTMTGSSAMHYPTELVNGDFELGSLHGWTDTGDGRVITALGTLPVQHGQFMGIISTGLGFTTTHGAISQSHRVTTSQSTLSFRWNFLSEEFMEYVGSIYQDHISVTLRRENGQVVTLLHETIDNFAANYTLTRVSPGVVFDQGDVFMTGWRTFTYDLTPYRGEFITLTFEVGDVGDSIYDSAVLLDNVIVE